MYEEIKDFCKSLIMLPHDMWRDSWIGKTVLAALGAVVLVPIYNVVQSLRVTEKYSAVLEVEEKSDLPEEVKYYTFEYEYDSEGNVTKVTPIENIMEVPAYKIMTSDGRIEKVDHEIFDSLQPYHIYEMQIHRDGLEELHIDVAKEANELQIASFRDRLPANRDANKTAVEREEAEVVTKSPGLQ